MFALVRPGDRWLDGVDAECVSARFGDDLSVAAGEKGSAGSAGAAALVDAEDVDVNEGAEVDGARGTDAAGGEVEASALVETEEVMVVEFAEEAEFDGDITGEPGADRDDEVLTLLTLRSEGAAGSGLEGGEGGRMMTTSAKLFALMIFANDSRNRRSFAS